MPAATEGWVHDLWTWSPAKWIYQLYYCQYLFIVIPGTVVGDMLLRWMKRDPTMQRHAWSFARLLAIVGLMLLFVGVELMGLFAVAMVDDAGHVHLMWLRRGLMRKPGDDTEKLFQQLFHWAIYWLVLGMFFEPYEGGIKKDHATMSYYFVTTGLAICMLIAFTIVLDIWQNRRWAALLTDNGQNPMIAYAGINNLILPILALTSIDAVAIRGCLLPLGLGLARDSSSPCLVAIAVSFCTRRKIFWRS